MQFSNNLEQYEHCANMLITLHQQGISAIPLNGKRPSYAIRWKQYQYTIPNRMIVDEWIEQSINSYGIICGQISGGLFVIDFDCPNLYQRFVKTFSNISCTYTVQTRRGYHVYLKSHVPIPSRQFKNCDIKGEGGYVVGTGSMVDDYRYRTISSSEIQTISYKTYQDILEWLSPQPKPRVQQISERPDTNFDVIAQYDIHVIDNGRNNALFTVACKARQHGLTENQTIQQLAMHHAQTKSSGHHKSESIDQRIREAVATIKSAFKSQIKVINDKSRLPNQVRETLITRQKSTIMARVLDTLFIHKTQNQWITLKELTSLCQSVHIGKKSLLRILTGDLAKINGRRIFKQYRYDDNIEYYASQGDSRTPNSRVGRRTQFVYRIPTIDELCQLLAVKGGVSDTLQPEDLHSAGAYRQALHRELIRRMSPMIRVDWYAKRLGVHRRTIFRYNIQLGVIATPMIQKERLTVKHVSELPIRDSNIDRGFTPGRWIETKMGKRYPAYQSIANNLVLYDKSPVMLCRQLPTRYTMPDMSIREGVELPDHLKTRSHMLTYTNVHEILPPDWATNKYELGGYLAVYNGYEWTFRPPLRVIAYQLTKKYEDGLVYFIQPLKP